MAMILASFDTKTGGMMVTVDGNPVPNVSYLCFSKHEDDAYASIETSMSDGDVSMSQRMSFSKDSDKPEIYDEGKTVAAIKDYFDRK